MPRPVEVFAHSLALVNQQKRARGEPVSRLVFDVSNKVADDDFESAQEV